MKRSNTGVAPMHRGRFYFAPESYPHSMHKSVRLLGTICVIPVDKSAWVERNGRLAD